MANVQRQQYQTFSSVSEILNDEGMCQTPFEDLEELAELIELEELASYSLAGYGLKDKSAALFL